MLLVNFWDLERLYQRYVCSYLNKQKLTFPILLDPGDKVKKLFRVDGIPKTFLYDREGRRQPNARPAKCPWVASANRSRRVA